MYSNIVQMFDARTAENPDQIAQYAKDERGSFYPITYGELQRKVRAMALALRSLGIRRGEGIGLISDNRAEWLVSDLAILSLGCPDIPRGRDAMPYEVEYILSATKARMVFAENNDQLSKILALVPSLPELETIVLIEGRVPESSPVRVISYSDLLEKGMSLLDEGETIIEKEIALTREDDAATIIFTSGTTGAPKGVVLTHHNMLYQLGEADKIIDFKPGWKWLSILPVWHAFERIIQYIVLYERNSIVYSKPIGKIMMTDIARMNPQVLSSVPRIWEVVKSGVNQSLESKSKAERKIFSFFLGVSKICRRLENTAKDLNPRFRKESRILRRVLAFVPYLLFKALSLLGDKLVFSKIKKKFGTSFIAGISGGGAIGKETAEFFDAIGIKVLNGYGLTETGPVIAVAGYYKTTKGFMHTFAGTEVKVIDKEGNILPPGEKGELLVRGEQVMKGYYNDSDRTAAIIDSDGFLHTGDLAVLDINGDISIVGRVKDTIVLLGGENVEPVPIENALKESEYIDSAVVVGQDRKYLGALLVINPKNVERYLKASNIPYVARDGLLRLEETRNLIMKEIVRHVSAEKGFKSFEQVSRFALLEKPFEVGRELSAKQEIKRLTISEIYKDEIERIFA